MEENPSFLLCSGMQRVGSQPQKGKCCIAGSWELGDRHVVFAGGSLTEFGPTLCQPKF